MLFVHHVAEQTHHTTEQAEHYTCPLQTVASSPEPGPQPGVKTHKASEEQCAGVANFSRGTTAAMMSLGTSGLSEK
jgi:hypothetical protein